MPAKVDADARRRALVLAAAELISERGIDALTHGALADRLQASTTVVTHYFKTKRELVLHTYQSMASRSRERVEAAMAASPDPLEAGLHALLPLDAATQTEWRVWLAFQGMSVGDSELTTIWAERAASAIGRIAVCVRREKAARALPRGIKPDLEARRLLALVNGMSFQAVVDPASWPPALLLKIVDTELKRLRQIP